MSIFSLLVMMLVALTPTAATVVCINSADVHNMIMSSIPTATSRKTTETYLVEVFTIFHDVTHPVTMTVADTAVIYYNSSSPYVYVVLFLKDCRVGAMTLPRAMYEYVISRERAA